MSNENAKILMSSKMNPGTLIWTIVGGVIANAILSALAIIPLIGFVFGILAFVCWIELVFAIIGVARAKATLTEDGICGANYYFGSFDIPFEQITKIKRKKKLTIIYYQNAAGKKQKAQIHGIKDEKTFTKACKDQLQAYQAAQTATEAPATEAPATEA